LQFSAGRLRIQTEIIGAYCSLFILFIIFFAKFVLFNPKFRIFAWSVAWTGCRNKLLQQLHWTKRKEEILL